MVKLVLDGLNEEDFRRSIQYRLREGSAGLAIERLRALIAPYTGPGALLPERFLTVTANDLELRGWETLGDAMSRHDQLGRPVTAVSIAFGWPGEDGPQPDALGNLRPHIETSYFNDGSFPFSQSDRDDLLEGYSAEGSTWAGDAVANDNAIGLDGIDDLSGALAALETQLLSSDDPDEAGLSAGSLGACLLSALLVEAVTARIKKDGMVRPVCMCAGSNGVYPYFDAPVTGMSSASLKAAAVEEEALAAAGHEVPGPRYSSLLITGIPRAKKRAVLVLEENEDQLANRLAGLRILGHGILEDADPAPAELPIAAALDEPEPASAASDGGLLLAKKPARSGYDFRDMLGPREDDLQQRLQQLMTTHTASIPAPPVAEPAATPIEPLPDWPDETEIAHAVDLPPISAETWLDETPFATPAPRQSGAWWRRIKAWWSGSAG